MNKTEYSLCLLCLSKTAQTSFFCDTFYYYEFAFKQSFSIGTAHSSCSYFSALSQQHSFFIYLGKELPNQLRKEMESTETL